MPSPNPKNTTATKPSWQSPPAPTTPVGRKTAPPKHPRLLPVLDRDHELPTKTHATTSAVPDSRTFTAIVLSSRFLLLSRPFFSAGASFGETGLRVQVEDVNFKPLVA